MTIFIHRFIEVRLSIDHNTTQSRSE